MKLKDFLSSINHNKTPLLDKDEADARLYTPFVVNRCLSYFADTIFHANEMNCAPWLDNKTQFDFYRIGVRKKKRFSPWLKKETEDNIKVIQEVYGYSEQKAREVLNILRPEDLEMLKKSLETGGIK
jgi:Bacteriophage clamp loader A subunit